MKGIPYILYTLCLMLATQALGQTRPARGDGSPAQPYEIACADHLLWLAQQVNAGTERSAHAIMIADIDLGGHPWHSIGQYEEHAYRGCFDGKGHRISGLSVSTGTTYDASDLHREGLFGCLDGATIRNIHLQQPSVTGCRRVGALAGQAYNSTIADCHATDVTIAGEISLGGLLGMARQCAILDVSVQGLSLSDTPSGNTMVYAGGIVGYGQELQSIARASIVSDTPIHLPSRSMIGGIVGYAYGRNTTIEDCRADISITGQKCVGTLAGQLSGQPGEPIVVTRCLGRADYVRGGTTSNYAGVGGLVGYTTYSNYLQCEASVQHVTGYTGIGGLIGSVNNQCSITQCISTGQEVAGSTSAHDRIGGLVGQASSEVSIETCGSYYTSVRGGKKVGGMVGYLSSNSRILRCWAYTTVNAIGTSPERGALIGYTSGIVRDSYALAQDASVCYCTAEALCERVLAMDASQFATGQVCWLLNQGLEQALWFQHIGEDTYPCMLASHGEVYAGGTIHCDGRLNQDVTFSNTPSASNITPHQMDNHGYCKACGTALPEWLDMKDGAYELHNENELRWYRDLINRSGIHSAYDARLVADITLHGEWTPIGNYADNRHEFNGHFDGQHHSISGLSITDRQGSYHGLFGYIREGSVRNLSLHDAHVQGKQYTGTIAGALFNACLTDCTTMPDCTVEGEDRVGGLAGQTESMRLGATVLQHCTNNASVTGTSAIGGITGYSYANGNTYDITYDHCTNNGAIRGTQYVGGLTGRTNYHAIVLGTGAQKYYTFQAWNYCRNRGTVQGLSHVGGLLGMADAVHLLRCSNYAMVTGTGTNVSALIGYISSLGATLQDCWWDTQVCTLPHPYQCNKAGSVTYTHHFSIGSMTREIQNASSRTTLQDIEEYRDILLGK